MGVREYRPGRPREPNMFAHQSFGLAAAGQVGPSGNHCDHLEVLIGLCDQPRKLHALLHAVQQLKNWRHRHDIPPPMPNDWYGEFSFTGERMALGATHSQYLSGGYKVGRRPKL